MPNVGDVVLYSVQGKSYNALVLHAHVNQPDHLGEEGEPLLHLLFLAPERESEITRAKAGYIPQQFIEYDVHHASHHFTEKYKRDNGLLYPAQIASHRGSGEWREVMLFHSGPPSPEEIAVACSLEAVSSQLPPCIPVSEPQADGDGYYHHDSEEN